MPYLLRPFTGYITGYITVQLQYDIHTTITLEMPARVNHSSSTACPSAVACAVPTRTHPVFGVGLPLGGSKGGSQADGKLGIPSLYPYFCSASPH